MKRSTLESLKAYMEYDPSFVITDQDPITKAKERLMQGLVTEIDKFIANHIAIGSHSNTVIKIKLDDLITSLCSYDENSKQVTPLESEILVFFEKANFNVRKDIDLSNYLLFSFTVDSDLVAELRKFIFFIKNIVYGIISITSFDNEIKVNTRMGRPSKMVVDKVGSSKLLTFLECIYLSRVHNTLLIKVKDSTYSLEITDKLLKDLTMGDFKGVDNNG